MLEFQKLRMALVCFGCTPKVASAKGCNCKVMPKGGKCKCEVSGIVCACDPPKDPQVVDLGPLGKVAVDLLEGTESAKLTAGIMEVALGVKLCTLDEEAKGCITDSGNGKLVFKSRRELLEAGMRLWVAVCLLVLADVLERTQSLHPPPPSMASLRFFSQPMPG